MLLIFIATALACSQSSGERFLGSWKCIGYCNWRAIAIEKSGSQFILNLGGDGQVPLSLDNGILKTGGKMGDIMYREDTEHIYFLFGEYEKRIDVAP